MNVVGHYNPGVQVVSFSRKEINSASNQFRKFRLPQPAFTRCGIEKRLNPVRIPCKELEFFVPSQWSFCSQGLLDDAFALALEFFHDFAWKRISQTKSYKINRAFAFQVRKFASEVKTRDQTVRVRFHLVSRHGEVGL